LQETARAAHGFATSREKRTRMLHDSGLVVICLVAGGVLYLTIFFWVTVRRVRDLGPPTPPPEHH
jgi:hypothetical protein